MFSRSAKIYDAVYSFKDYAAEAEAVHLAIADRCPAAQTLLDVACGTGKHLERLQRWYRVEGLDLDDGLLAVAHDRLPDTPLHQADMTHFALGRRYDAIACLFSAIGYVGTPEKLVDTFGCIARHLQPDGVVVIEPWFTPDAWVVDRPALLVVDQPELKIARMNVSARDGRFAILDFHYLVGTPAGVWQFSERHEMALFTDDEYKLAFEDAGLIAEHDPQGLTGRGLYIARHR
jgi:SAM-dependent methyltransferase